MTTATIARLTQWRTSLRITYKRFNTFKVGHWNWHLSVYTGHSNVLSIGVNLEDGQQPPPFARFILRLLPLGATNQHTHTLPVQEISFQTNEVFQEEVGSIDTERFIVDVEVLDLKIIPPDGGEPTSIWPYAETLEILPTERTPTWLSHMFNEGIHTDVTINTADGTLKAHKCVLAASSPVFEGMFLHNMKEKESSTVEINDMSLELCGALLSSIYGTIKAKEFSMHRFELLAAADKYDIKELKNLCEKSFIMDISSENVLERLQMASLYNLSELKKECFKYLFDFWKIFDVKDEFKDLCKNADKELMQEIIQEMVTGLSVR